LLVSYQEMPTGVQNICEMSDANTEPFGAGIIIFLILAHTV